MPAGALSLDYRRKAGHQSKDPATTSQDWWPVDLRSNYGPLSAWSASARVTYRTGDGRGAAQQRFELVNSCVSTTPIRQGATALWLIKQNTERSPGDLDGAHRECRAGADGLSNLGFKGGRANDWGARPGPLGSREETPPAMSATAATANWKAARVPDGLIYVIPEGPNSATDPPGGREGYPRDLGRMARTTRRPLHSIAVAIPSARRIGVSIPSKWTRTCRRRYRAAGIGLAEQVRHWQGRR